MSATHPEPTAVGNLDKTPLCHLLLYCRDRGLTGTLCLWEPDASHEGLGDAQLYLELGIVLAACTVDVLGPELESALVPLSCRRRGAFSFYEGRRLLAENGQLLSGRVTPETALTAALRGQYRNDLVNATLGPLADRRLQLKTSVDLAAFQFTREEASFAQFLAQHPSTIKELIGRGRPSPTTIRRLLYALRITRSLAVLPAAQPLHSGTVAVPQAPELVPPRVSMPHSPTPVREQVERASVRPDARRKPGSLRPSNQRPSSQRVMMRPPSERPDRNSQRTIISHRAPNRPSMPAPPRPGRSKPPTDLPAALARRWEQIVARRASIAHESYFEMLGLRSNASFEEVRDAFEACESLWSPASLPAALASLTDDVATIQAQLRDAHATLTNPKRRTEYLALLQGEGSKGSKAPKARSRPPGERDRAEEAAEAYHGAVHHLKRREFAAAVELLQKAAGLAPQDPEISASLAFARYELNGRRGAAAVEAIGTLEGALADDPNCERAHHFLGVVLKQIGDIRPAMHHFHMAATLSPSNIEAARELRLHAMRARGPERAGLLGKLLNSFAPPRKTGS